MPTTIEQRERSLHQPAFCELLPVRDILHDVIVRTTGAFVAGYELSGINSYYHNDEGRNRTKVALEALIRSLPERSMRMQARFEITEGLGDLLENYKQQLRTENPTLLALDRARLEAWIAREKDGFYLRPLVACLLSLEPGGSSRIARRGLRQHRQAHEPRWLQPFSEEVHPTHAAGTRRPAV